MAAQDSSHIADNGDSLEEGAKRVSTQVPRVAATDVAMVKVDERVEHFNCSDHFWIPNCFSCVLSSFVAKLLVKGLASKEGH
jgi:hypothetical protein